MFELCGGGDFDESAAAVDVVDIVADIVVVVDIAVAADPVVAALAKNTDPLGARFVGLLRGLAAHLRCQRGPIKQKTQILNPRRRLGPPKPLDWAHLRALIFVKRLDSDLILHHPGH